MSFGGNLKDDSRIYIEMERPSIVIMILKHVNLIYRIYTNKYQDSLKMYRN